jgi:DNA-binding response OmpR family regulator
MAERTSDQGSPVVLVVEDEPAVAEGYELWLSDSYEIRLATDGRKALEMVDETVDVVLLDRMMPELSGEQVLDEIRGQEIDCRVAMVTAVEAGFDVIEMGFDAYVTKPPEREELIDTVETLLDRATLDDDLQEYYSLMARKGSLQVQKAEEELTENEQYQELLERIESKQTEVDANLGDMSSNIDFVSTVREFDEEAHDREYITSDGDEMTGTGEGSR